MKRLIVLVLMIASIGSRAVAANVEAQSSSGKSGKGRIIGIVVGAAGGFALGAFAGLNWFDDAVNSDRKVWMTAIGFGAAGGVGGYFLGRAGSRTSQQPGLQTQLPALDQTRRITLRRPESPHAALMLSRAANVRAAAALTGVVDGIINAWPQPHVENSSPSSPLRLP